MSKPRGWKPTLRYSPVNGIIVDWGINGEPFSMGCLPTKACEAPSPAPVVDACGPCGEPIVEAVDTYDWYRWVPEVIVGLRDANEDMAASYARRAAIMFATGARVLRRQVAVELQPGVWRYPIDTFEDERAVGVARVDSARGQCQSDACTIGGVYVGRVQVDQARQEIVISDTHGACGAHAQRSGPKHLLVTIWATPTEDSCKHDAFLYETYRGQITMGARGMFMEEAHAYGSYQTNRGLASSRGDALMFSRADRASAKFQNEIRRALVDIETAGIDTNPVPNLWAAGCATGARA